ncbi:hypothetical protein M885DRAFT_592555 [Pelagophyceae sp. CCMP2097]|nr:hypothetical protein M885DRAFT_592555 [Pelagophyceae sp. CCMP2097]
MPGLGPAGAAAPPSYTSYVSERSAREPAAGAAAWALQACAADPAMRLAFAGAGAVRGYAGGAALRAYCEREGLMRVGGGGAGVEKRVLAAAWELADVDRDARGLGFDAFCVFMHLLCIATAGGDLPKTLPDELVPPSARRPPRVAAPAEGARPAAPPLPAPRLPTALATPLRQRDDAELARALQDEFNAEPLPQPIRWQAPPWAPLQSPPQGDRAAPPRHAAAVGAAAAAADEPAGQSFALDDSTAMDVGALLRLLVSQGGVVELGSTLYASDDAFQNERWVAGGGFASAHLLASDPLAWSSEDCTVQAPARHLVAPPRPPLWNDVTPWTAYVCLAETDRHGWLYSRSLSNGEAIEDSAAPFAGAVCRRRRWIRAHSRQLLRASVASALAAGAASGVSSDRAPASVPRGAPALLARIQDSWRLGVSEVSRRIAAAADLPHAGRGPEATDTFAERWASPAAAKCRSGLATFVRNFGRHETAAVSDDARATRVRRFVTHAARLLRQLRPWADMSETDFLADVDSVEALLFGALLDSHFELVRECGDVDAGLALRLGRLQCVTPQMLDAAAVEHLEPWPRAVDTLRQIPATVTPRRKIKLIRDAIGDMFACLAELAREGRAGAQGESPVPGADDLLPLVILATLRARIPKLNSEIRFIELYSAQERLSGEDGFLLTQLAAAAAFLETVDASTLRGVDAAAFGALLRGETDGLAPEAFEERGSTVADEPPADAAFEERGSTVADEPPAYAAFEGGSTAADEPPAEKAFEERGSTAADESPAEKAFEERGSIVADGPPPEAAFEERGSTAPDEPPPEAAFEERGSTVADEPPAEKAFEERGSIVADEPPADAAFEERGSTAADEPPTEADEPSEAPDAARDVAMRDDESKVDAGRDVVEDPESKVDESKVDAVAGDAAQDDAAQHAAKDDERDAAKDDAVKCDAAQDDAAQDDTAQYSTAHDDAAKGDYADAAAAQDVASRLPAAEAPRGVADCAGDLQPSPSAVPVHRAPPPPPPAGVDEAQQE